MTIRLVVKLWHADVLVLGKLIGVTGRAEDYESDESVGFVTGKNSVSGQPELVIATRDGSLRLTDSRKLDYLSTSDGAQAVERFRAALGFFAQANGLVTKVVDDMVILVDPTTPVFPPKERDGYPEKRSDAVGPSEPPLPGGHFLPIEQGVSCK